MHADGLPDTRIRRSVAVSAILLVLLAVSMLGQVKSSDAAVPSNFKRHVEQYWVWYAPRDWVASSGKYDLNISSPTGTLWNKYGYSALVCPNSASQWFDYLRTSFRKGSGGGFGLYSKPLGSARYTSIGKAHKLGPAYGDAYFREKDLWAGRTKSGKRVQGEIVMDVFVVDAFSGSCGQRFQARGAPVKGNAASIRTLRKVQSTITQQNL